jgi:hypothetical protein
VGHRAGETRPSSPAITFLPHPYAKGRLEGGAPGIRGVSAGGKPSLSKRRKGTGTQTLVEGLAIGH